MVRLLEFLAREEPLAGKQVCDLPVFATIAKRCADSWLRPVGKHRVAEPDECSLEGRWHVRPCRLVDRGDHAFVIGLYVELGAVPCAGEGGAGKLGCKGFGVYIEALEVVDDGTDGRDAQAPSKCAHMLLHLVDERAYVNNVRDRSGRDFQDGHIDVREIDSRQGEEAPVDECANQWGFRRLARASQHEQRRSECCDCQPTDPLFTLDWSRLHPRRRRNRLYAGLLDLAVCSECQPAVFKVAAAHTNAVVAENEQLFPSVEVHFDARRVGVVGVLEELADRSWHACYLLPAEHVHGTGAGLEAGHSARAGLRSGCLLATMTAC